MVLASLISPRKAAFPVSILPFEKMNYVIEATSIFGWWCTFHIGTSFLPKDVISTVISGAGSGMVIAATTLPYPGIRQFPETLMDRKLLNPKLKSQNILKLTAGHAIFFSIYSGLRQSIYKARDANGRTDHARDWEDCINDFMCGGIAGLCYRAASYAYGKGPVSNQWVSQPRILAVTFLKTATATMALESIDYLVTSRNKIHE